MKPYYESKGITIYHGDCRDILPTLEWDVMITDPPYGIGYSTNYRDDGPASWVNTTIQNDQDASLRDWVVDRLSGKPSVIFGTWKVQRPKDVRAVLIWDKGPAFGMGDLKFPWKGSYEEIYVFGDGWKGHRDEGVLKGHMVVSWESKGRMHPTQKPVSLIGHFIEKAPAGVVIDPFMGSGTTLVAAKESGRKAIGIEVEEKYCEMAVNRLAQEVLFS
jgi:DNA modification methylase